MFHWAEKLVWLPVGLQIAAASVQEQDERYGSLSIQKGVPWVLEHPYEDVAIGDVWGCLLVKASYGIHSVGSPANLHGARKGLFT